MLINTRCEWKGSECNASHFKKVQVDGGICYTFNHDVGPGSIINDTGIYTLYTLYIYLIILLWWLYTAKQ